MDDADSQRGEIWPPGRTTLAAEVEGRRPITVKRLQAVGFRLYRTGDDGATVLFNVAQAPAAGVGG